MDTGQGGLFFPVPEAQRSSFSNELERTAQALSDLAKCASAELVLVAADGDEQEAELVETLLQRAQKSGFIGARVSLSEASFESLDEVVRELISNLRLPARSADGEAVGLLGFVG